MSAELIEGSIYSGGKRCCSSGSINKIWSFLDCFRSRCDVSWSSRSCVVDPSDAAEETARLNDDEKLRPSDAALVIEELEGCRCMQLITTPTTCSNRSFVVEVEAPYLYSIVREQMYGKRHSALAASVGRNLDYDRSTLDFYSGRKTRFPVVIDLHA